MTTLTLSDPGGTTWDLYQVQLSEDATEASADVFTPPGSDGSDSFISVLSERETFNLTGLVTAPRLSTQSGYSSDWRTALAEYAQRGEGFCTGAQFEGYTLKERDRDRLTLNVVIEEFQWTYESGVPFQLSFQLTLRRGDGLLPDGTLSIGSASPGATSSVSSIGGTSLDGFDRLECTKSLGDVTVAERAFADSAGENDITAGQGATREWTYAGQYPGSNNSRNSFDDTIRGYIDDTARSFATVFPGYSANAKVLDFESTRDANHGAGMHEYQVALQESQ